MIVYAVDLGVVMCWLCCDVLCLVYVDAVYSDAHSCDCERLRLRSKGKDSQPN